GRACGQNQRPRIVYGQIRKQRRGEGPALGSSEGVGDGSVLGSVEGRVVGVVPWREALVPGVKVSRAMYLLISEARTRLKIWAGKELPVTLMPWTCCIGLPDGYPTQTAMTKPRAKPTNQASR